MEPFEQTSDSGFDLSKPVRTNGLLALTQQVKLLDSEAAREEMKLEVLKRISEPERIHDYVRAVVFFLTNQYNAEYMQWIALKAHVEKFRSEETEILCAHNADVTIREWMFALTNDSTELRAELNKLISDHGYILETEYQDPLLALYLEGTDIDVHKNIVEIAGRDDIALMQERATVVVKMQKRAKMAVEEYTKLYERCISKAIVCVREITNDKEYGKMDVDEDVIFDLSELENQAAVKMDELRMQRATGNGGSIDVDLDELEDSEEE